MKKSLNKFIISKYFCTYTNQELDVKSKLFKMTLANVQKYGWTNRAIAVSANDLNFSTSLSNGVYKNGIIDIVHQSMDNWNKELKQYYDSIIESDESCNRLDYLLSHNNLKEGIKKRLLLQSQFTNTWSQAMVLGMRPNSISITVSNLWDIVNIIVNNHPLVPLSYKLVILKIYLGAEVYMLTDKSNNYSQTFKFLDQMLSLNLKLLNTFSIVSNNTNVLSSLLLNSLSIVMPYDLSKVSEIIKLKEEQEKSNRI